MVVYNACARARGPFVDLVPAEVAQAITVSAFGGFLVAQQAAKRMLPNKHGAILFTGASASVKGYPQSAPFAMGKFALRGLAQSMARELSPQGIHVAHFVIDGGIRSAARPSRPTVPMRCSIPMRSRKPTGTCCSSHAAPGPGSSRCGRGWRSSRNKRRRPKEGKLGIGGNITRDLCGSQSPAGAGNLLRLGVDLLDEPRQSPIVGIGDKPIAGLAGQTDHGLVRTQGIAEQTLGAERRRRHSRLRSSADPMPCPCQ